MNYMELLSLIYSIIGFNFLDPFSESGLGWTFESADSGKLSHALGNCLLTYREYKKSWEGLQRRGMTLDLSWNNAALQYEEVLLAAKYQW